MKSRKVAILHYSAPPVIGGVEAVIKAHLDQLIRAGYSCTVIAGRGDASFFPPGVDLMRVPEVDSQHPEVIRLNQDLEKGSVPDGYKDFETRLVHILDPIVREIDHVIIHNVFTKHFNLPLTGALNRMLDHGTIRHAIAWCHDFTWTSPSSRSKVHPGYPWDLLRTQRADCTYVVVSRERQLTLASLFDCPVEEVKVVYNGVDPIKTLGISEEGSALIKKLGLLEKDLIVLMPVRVTQAKNIEFALKVLQEIKMRGWKPMLVVTGPPDPHDPKNMEYYQSLRDQRAELGIEDSMRFVFESGPDPEKAYYIDEQIVGDLYRIADVMFMPSHREGFGMPVLEAGLVGIPVISREVPATKELAANEALMFGPQDHPAKVAELLVDILAGSATARLRRRVRQEYNWQAIFEDAIWPLLKAGEGD